MPHVTPLPEDTMQAPAFARILGRRPEVAEAWSAVSSTLRFSGLLPTDLKEAVRQATAGRIGCQFCATVGEPLGEADRRTSLAVAVAQLIAEDHASVNEKTFDVLREEFTEDEIVELIALICFVCVGAQTFGSVMGVEPATDEEREAYSGWMAARRGA